MKTLGVPFDFIKPSKYEKCELIYDFPITNESNKYIKNGDLVCVATFDNLNKEEIISLIEDGDLLMVKALETDLKRPQNMVKVQIVNGNYILSTISDFVDRKTIVVENYKINNQLITGKVLMSFRDLGNTFVR